MTTLVHPSEQSERARNVVTCIVVFGEGHILIGFGISQLLLLQFIRLLLWLLSSRRKTCCKEQLYHYDY